MVRIRVTMLTIYPPKLYARGCCKGRCRNVHNVVADEDRTEKLGRLVFQNIKSHGCTLIPFIC